MIRTKDHKTMPIFDPWEFLGPKRRKLMDQSWAGLFKNHMLNELPVGTLKPYFASGWGRPTKELYSILGALVLQQMHDLSDEQTVYQMAFNQQWHYALDITSSADEATYLCEKTLYNFRKIMTDNRLDEHLFNTTTEKLAQVFNVDTTLQRLDSVHIQSNMRHLSRIGIFAKTIHKFLTNLKRRYPQQFQQVDTDIADRYLSGKAPGCFSLVKPSEAAATLKQAARDLYRLVQQFGTDEAICSMHSYKLLARVLAEQCTIGESTDEQPHPVELKPAGQISSESLQNPSDPDAGYSANKGKGYQVQLMETYSEQNEPEQKQKQLNLITHVAVESADTHDAHALMPAIESTQDRDLGPQQVVCDAAYGADENCQAAQQHSVEVVSPVMGTTQKTHGLESFEFGEQGEVIRCPQGHAPVKVKKRKNRHSAVFGVEQCGSCPFFDQCSVKKGTRRYYLNYDDKQQRCAVRRAAEQTDEFQDRYRRRAGVEATMSEYDRRTGVKKLRVRGLKAVRFCAVLKAVGLNILRAAAVKRAQTEDYDPDYAAGTAHYGLIWLFKERVMHFWGSTIKFLRVEPGFYDLDVKNTA